jgi:hypothetical protein
MGESMTKKEFEQLVVTKLQNKLSSYGVKVQLTSVMKESDQMIDVILVFNDNKMMPIIRIDPLYHEFLLGAPAERITEKLLSTICKKMPIDIECVATDIVNFESVRHNIFASLVNTDLNKIWLSDKPHFDIGDLSITYHVLLERDDNAIMRIPIVDTVFEEWGIEAATLHNTAMKNTSMKYPPIASPIEEKLNELIGFESEESLANQFGVETGLIVVSNSLGMYGAIYMFDTDLLKDLAKYLNTKLLYLFPSSIHEFIVCPVDLIPLKDANQMVQEVNVTLDTKEVLSNHVYVYNAIANKIC